MAVATTSVVFTITPNQTPPICSSKTKLETMKRTQVIGSLSSSTRSQFPCFFVTRPKRREQDSICFVLACLPSNSYSSSSKTRLFVSGLSFRTTEDSLRKSFQNFGQLVEVNLVMDKIANRPRGFAFLRYATEEESQKAIEGMHGKFLDGRVIFVEVAKSRSELRQGLKQNQRQF